MGFIECKSMESRRDFCPGSSSKLTQSIIKDHMVSHYKKIYSAKAAIDNSVPKSLIRSVKYNDQIRQICSSKSRPQSAQSFSQRNSRTSCFSSQGRLYEDTICSRSSTVSSPAFETSFHTKELAYPLRKVFSEKPFHNSRTVSEMNHGPVKTSHRKLSTCSLEVLGDHSCYKTFQDPGQKTYSGDLLKKHSQLFTQGKPFIPKTLRSDKNSYLSNYRYYRAPHRTSTQVCTRSSLVRQEKDRGRAKIKECVKEFYEPSQGLNTEHEWSADEFNGIYFSESRQQSRVIKSKDYHFSDSPYRVSPEDGKSSRMKNVSTEEDELMYLEFISAVTEDILSKGHISERVLDRVIERHINMNRHKLDESKMHHLVEVLRKDFEEPTNISIWTTDQEKKESDLQYTFLPDLEYRKRQVKTKENNDLFPYTSLIKYCNTPDYGDPLLLSTPLSSPERKASPTKSKEKEGEGIKMEQGISSPWLRKYVSCDVGGSEEDLHQNQIDTTASKGNENLEYPNTTSDEEFHQDQILVSNDEQPEELEDLGRRLSKTLKVSNNTHSNDGDK